jgi:sigma-E factor negative regulatory protein RseB
MGHAMPWLLQCVRLTRLLSLVLAMSVAAPIYAADERLSDARSWLERMSRSLAERNYDMRFVHLVGGHAENMRIIHRVLNGSVAERLVSLDGSGREVIRNATEVVCYLPDRRTVLVDRRTGSSPLLGAVPEYNQSLEANYALADRGVTRILNRPARVIVVAPRDQFRYGYRLWLDVATAMPLKSQLCDGSGRVIEQVVLSELSTPAKIDDSLLKTSIAAEGFRWIRQQGERQPQVRSLGWVVINPPQGFRLTVTQLQSIGGGSPVRHLVLSDGLASVSVFIEPQDPAVAQVGTADGRGSSSPVDGVGQLAQLGASLAFSTQMQEHRITAVGEVPESTLRAIAAAVQREPDQSAQSANNPQGRAYSAAPKGH